MDPLSWTPWHGVVQLREELRDGTLPMHLFAADLDEVANPTEDADGEAASAAERGGGRRMYREPAAFFSLTYPTYNLRELVREVLHRLAGRSEKAVHQLELTYGGGKTHTLLALYHLVRAPAELPDLPAVSEFKVHAAIEPPAARVATLCLDKLDVERGMAVRAPDGEVRQLTAPWSVLAFQLAGREGLRRISADGSDAERETAPAENLLRSLLAAPQASADATLVLLDEVLTYAREKAAADRVWRGRLVDFFQYLTQAATKVDRCAVVASLLAADVTKSDALGKEITQELYGVFRRQREEAVLPVVKEDVAELLRRRLLRPSAEGSGGVRPQALAAAQGVKRLQPEDEVGPRTLEQRLLETYPFHPDLLDVLYAKWTSLEGFQRTRGVLRVLALALREAEPWDDSPVVGPTIFLAPPERVGLPDAARELTNIAASELYEAKKQAWAGILESELTKARQIQAHHGGLAHREIEQAVVATFLHSQPVGQRAMTEDLLRLIGPTQPDPIELTKGLQAWAWTSYWLDDRYLGEVAETALPSAWRLGNRPNLNQMHAEACRRVPDGQVQQRLRNQISRCRPLTEGAGATGGRVHSLPTAPRQVPDDGAFHFVLLGPEAASRGGEPSEPALRFLAEAGGADRPRVACNAMVLAVPTPDGLEVARDQVRRWLGWEEVAARLGDEEVDAERGRLLRTQLQTARDQAAEAIRHAYATAVTLDEEGTPQAYALVPEDRPLFDQIQADPRLRVQRGPLHEAALLPGGPYDLWRGEWTVRRVRDLVGAFGELAHLPKMLDRETIYQTVARGVERGHFVLRLASPDGAARTWWAQPPEERALREPAAEVVLADRARLTQLTPAVFDPGELTELWEGGAPTLGDLHALFAGGGEISRPGGASPLGPSTLAETIRVPAAAPSVVDHAVAEAVREGRLWVSGPDGTSVWNEPVPEGTLAEAATLHPPPPRLAPSDVLPESIPEAWHDGTTTAAAVADAVRKRSGEPLPWGLVRQALTDAFNTHLVEPLDAAQGRPPWPCSAEEADRFPLRRAGRTRGGTTPQGTPARAETELAADQIQDLGERVHEVVRAGAALGLRFRLRVEADHFDAAVGEELEEVNRLLQSVCPGLRVAASDGTDGDSSASCEGAAGRPREVGFSSQGDHDGRVKERRPSYRRSASAGGVPPDRIGRAPLVAA